MVDLLSDLPPMPYIRYEQHTLVFKGVRIRATYWPYVPGRGFDWSAVTDDYNGDEGEPVGRGGSLKAAIADLMEQLEDRA